MHCIQTYKNPKQINQLQALENLTIVLLLQKPIFNNSKRLIQVLFNENKILFLEEYILRYNLSSHVTYKENLVTLHHSITVENLVRDWTPKGQVIGINPNKVSSDLFMLWICLFAKKTDKNVIIETELEDQVKLTICRFFRLHLQTNLIDRGNIFQIRPFTNLILKSYQENRFLEETKELNNLLTDKDRNKLKKILNSWEDYNGVS